MRKREAGFTLAEMIVALGVTTILLLAVLACPALAGASHSQPASVGPAATGSWLRRVDYSTGTCGVMPFSHQVYRLSPTLVVQWRPWQNTA